MSELLALCDEGAYVYRLEGNETQLKAFATRPCADSTTAATGEFEFKKLLFVQGGSLAEWDTTGEMLSMVTNERVLRVYHSGSLRSFVELEFDLQIKQISTSPKSKYILVTCYNTNSSPNQETPNCYVCRISSERLEKVLSFCLKGCSNINEVIQFANDDSLMLRKGNGELHIYDLDQLPQSTSSSSTVSSGDFAVPIPGLESLKVSPAKQHLLSVCTFSKCKSPGASQPVLNLWRINVSCQTFDRVCNYVISKGADECDIQWSHDGQYAVAEVKSDIDKAGTSYYGMSQLLLVMLDGTCERIIPETKGPINCHSWRPSSGQAELFVSYGPNPPDLHLFDVQTNLKPSLTFGKVRRNYSRWSKSGRYLVAAGFGNLPGEIDVWDRAQERIIGSTKIPCTVECEFSDNEYFIMCATTCPRLRVDNCINIIRYNGDLLCHLDFKELYHVQWKHTNNPPVIPRGTRRPLLEYLKEITPAVDSVYRPKGVKGTGILPGETGEKQLVGKTFVEGKTNSKKENIIPGLDPSQMTSGKKKKEKANAKQPPPKNKPQGMTFELKEDSF